jgi:L-iditol 2-dehydrogenase
MEAMRVDRFDTVLITGMGPVGLGGVINGVHRGARVIAVESHPYRQALARKLGAAEVLDPTASGIRERIAELTGGVGADKCIDCSGAAEAQRLLIETVRRRGEVSFVGEGGEVPVKVSDDLIRKGIVLRGVWHYRLPDYPKLARIIVDCRDKLSTLITHTFPMERVAEAWELQLAGNCGKVILHPWSA